MFIIIQILTICKSSRWEILTDENLKKIDQNCLLWKYRNTKHTKNRKRFLSFFLELKNFNYSSRSFFCVLIAISSGMTISSFSIIQLDSIFITAKMKIPWIWVGFFNYLHLRAEFLDLGKYVDFKDSK